MGSLKCGVCREEGAQRADKASGSLNSERREEAVDLRRQVALSEERSEKEGADAYAHTLKHNEAVGPPDGFVATHMHQPRLRQTSKASALLPHPQLLRSRLLRLEPAYSSSHSTAVTPRG